MFVTLKVTAQAVRLSNTPRLEKGEMGVRGRLRRPRTPR
jgi:hypothetical protein